MVQRLAEITDLTVVIAENSTHGIVVMDENGYCLFANRAWTALTGFSAEDMATNPVHDWVPHHHADGSPFPMEEWPIGCTLGKNERMRSHEDLFFKKDGIPFHVSCATQSAYSHRTGKA
jgi:PAS domain S-box-containing protein